MLAIISCPEPPLVTCAVVEGFLVPLAVAVAKATDAEAVKEEKEGNVTPAFAQRDCA